MKQRGFTLIELLIVIALTGVVSVLSVGFMVDAARQWQTGVAINTLQYQSEQASAVITGFMDQAVAGTLVISDGGQSAQFSIHRESTYPKFIYESNENRFEQSRVGYSLHDDIEVVKLSCQNDHLTIEYDNEIIHRQPSVTQCFFRTSDLGEGHDWFSVRYMITYDDMQNVIEVSRAIY